MASSVQTKISDEEIQNVDQIGIHLNNYTLHFKKEEYENEWKLISIKGKKWITLLGSIFCVVQDVEWTMILMDTTLIGKIERGLMDIFMLLAWFNVYV